MFRRYKYNTPANKKLAWAVIITAGAITAIFVGLFLMPNVPDDSCPQCKKPSGFYVDFESDDYMKYLSIEKIDPSAIAKVDNLALFNSLSPFDRPFSKSLALSGAGGFSLAFPPEGHAAVAGLKVSFDVIVPNINFDFNVVIGDGVDGIEFVLVSGYWSIKHVVSGNVYVDQMFKTNSSLFQMPAANGINTFDFEFLSSDTFSVSYNGQPAIGMHTGGQNSWVMEDVPGAFGSVSFSCKNVMTSFLWLWIDNVHAWRP